MNVTENYLLKQMQTLAAAMSNVPQTGNGKDKTAEGSTFQDMMDQAGKASESASASKDAESKDPLKEKDELETEGLEKEPVEGEEEELKPELLAANPNAVSIMDLFRPDVVQPAEEPMIEVPVDAIAETSVEGPELALDGELPQMETNVEADVQSGISMEQQQPETFQQVLEEVPQERPVENTVEEAPVEAAPEQVENTDKPQVEVPEEVETVEVEAETDEEPKAEGAEVEQPVFHETQSTPVKVGETYETVDTEQPEMEQKLNDIIQTAVQNGTEKIEIRLAPQNLGSLTIEMTKDANGALQVVLHASNARAAGVLNQHMDGLQAALRGYSQDEVRIEVQRSDDSQEQHFKHADPDGRGNQQRQQQQEHREEKHSGEAFMQKLRLGLFSEI